MAFLHRTLARLGNALPVMGQRSRGRAGHVIFAAFTEGRFHGYGKLEPKTFLPPFCAELKAAGVSVEFVTTPQALARAAGPDSVTIHIYKEVAGAPEVLSDSPLVFNTPDLGRLIANKDATNRKLTMAGIAVPRLIESATSDVTTFSNDLASTGAEVTLEYRPGRYNTEFIDTRVTHNNADYYTTVRLLCVGGTLVHCNVGARAVTSNQLSVHGRDTPRDPALIEHLFQILVADRLADLRCLATDLGDTLGPGFFGHDLVIDRNSGVAHVCETGFKFDGRAYIAHLSPILSALPSQQIYQKGAFQRAAAQAFLAECRKRNALLPL